MASNLNPTDVKQGNGAEGMVPVIDISELDGPQHDQVVETIVKAAETLGFFQVVNHGLSDEFLDEMKDSIHRFHNQSEENKAVYLREVSPNPLVTFNPNDLPEMARRLDFLFLSYTNEQDALKYWPDSCKEVALKYLKTSSKIAERLVQVLMNNLGVTLDESTVDACIGGIDLSMNCFHTCPGRVADVAIPKHTDPSTLTVLLQDHVGGFFGKLKDDGDKGEWVEVKPTPGALIILVGDCLQVLSNGKYKGGEHYIQPPTASETRVSCPVFMNPRSTARVRPLVQVVEKDGGRPRYKEFLFSEYKEYAYSFDSSTQIQPIDTVQSSLNA